jgi:hypothetical protein
MRNPGCTETGEKAGDDCGRTTKAAERLSQRQSGQTEYDLAPPRADAMIESPRAFRYDLPTVADLVDNSLSAMATINIWITVSLNGTAYSSTLLDDGSGMNEGELQVAMRLGSRSSLEERAPIDLGCLGLA